MTHALADNLNWDAKHDRQRGERVAQVVDADAPDPGASHQPCEVPTQVVGVDGTAIRGRENQIMIIPQRPEFAPPLVLGAPVLA